MKLFFKELIILILLGFSSHIIAADSMTETEHKGKALVENIQGKLDSFEKKNLSLLSESKSNVELASKIIDWSAMVFAALAVLLIVAGAVGLREFSNFKNIKEEMTNEIRKVKKEISKIEGVRTEIQDELGSLKRKIKKESNDIFKTIYLLNEAITSFNTGNLQNTINTLTEILRINPNDYEATCLLARSYSGQEEYEKAIKTTEIATELSSNPHRALYIMAESYRRMGDFDEAINVHRRSLELELRSPPQNSLAYCYYKKRDFKEAEKEFKNSLKISRNPTAVIGLAKSLLMQGLHEEACEYCYEGIVLTKEEIEEGTTLVWSYYNLATAHFILNNKEKCLNVIEKSILITRKNKAQIREQIYDYELMASNKNINRELSKRVISQWKKSI